MNSKSSSCGDLSVDSLNDDYVKEKSPKKIERKESSEATILVPFYEKDVLMKIPKCSLKKTPSKRQRGCKNNGNKDESDQESRSYLMNKNRQNPKRQSYLEIFRKQFLTSKSLARHNHIEEIRSLSPEFGDTERESFSETENDPNTDFYNTEAYNDIYYDKIMNNEIANILNKNFEQTLQFTDAKSKCNEDDIMNNLKSISEVSQPRRHARRATMEPVNPIRLGGLGPDMENIKPRLERARSLQRYSEKVRMENRLKIYKKSIQDDNEKIARTDSAKKENIEKTNKAKPIENVPSYLINKKNIVKSKLTSKRKEPRTPTERETHPQNIVKVEMTKNQNKDPKFTIKQENSGQENLSLKKKEKIRVQSSRKMETKIDTPQENVEVPLGLSYMTNIDALRSLEEKHRMFQEKVKQMAIND